MKTHSKIPSPRSNVAATFRFLVVLIGIFPIMLWWQALIPIVWWWVRWMECWLQHQDFHKPCLRVKESQKNSMHTWHIEPCVFFCYVVFSCNNLNNEVFILLRHYLSKNAAYFAAKIRRKRRVTKLIRLYFDVIRSFFTSNSTDLSSLVPSILLEWTTALVICLPFLYIINWVVIVYV